MIYVPAGKGFKWGAFEQDWRGYDRIRNWDDVAGAGVSAADDGNILFENGGWYVLFFEAEIVGSSVQYDLHIYPGAAYVTGAGCYTGDWLDADPTWQLVAPADQTGEWASPAFIGSGELRAYIKVPGYDWWHTEFTLHNGEVYWRDVNIIDSWSELGSDYAVQVLLYSMAALASIALASCTGDYDDWASPQSYPQEDAAAAYGVTVAAGTEANVAMPAEDGDVVLVSITTDNPQVADYSLKGLTINGAGMESEPMTLNAEMVEGNVVVDATELAKAVDKLYGSRASVARTLDVTTDFSINLANGDAVTSAKGVTQATVTPAPLPEEEMAPTRPPSPPPPAAPTIGVSTWVATS